MQYKSFKNALKFDFPQITSDASLHPSEAFQTALGVPEPAWDSPRTPRCERKVRRKIGIFLDFSGKFTVGANIGSKSTMSTRLGVSTILAAELTPRSFRGPGVLDETHTYSLVAGILEKTL